jgi:hypothetical protein
MQAMNDGQDANALLQLPEPHGTVSISAVVVE